jgi:hypothetical protein
MSILIMRIRLPRHLHMLLRLLIINQHFPIFTIPPTSLCGNFHDREYRFCLLEDDIHFFEGPICDFRKEDIHSLLRSFLYAIKLLLRGISRRHVKPARKPPIQMPAAYESPILVPNSFQSPESAGRASVANEAFRERYSISISYHQR